MRLLQRYLFLELLKVFACLLSALTVLLVFVGTVHEVSENGLGPLQILQILPYLVPSLMPFTIPATSLLTVCVVYGRIASAHEVTAAKPAGINVLSLLWPAFFLGGALCVCSFVLADTVIPWAVKNIQRTVTMAMEDIFLDLLRTNHVVKDDHRGYSITVFRVDGKRLIMPTFQWAPQGHGATTVQAQEATLEFDLENEQLILHLHAAYVETPNGVKGDFNYHRQEIPLPQEIKKAKPRHRSIRDLFRESRQLNAELELMFLRRDVEVAFALGEGNFQQLLKPELNVYSPAYQYKLNDLAKLSTEVHSRFALSASCILFTLVGGPFAILQARRQFLTNFVTCFLPILLLYYPLVALMMNLSKTGNVNPVWAMWLANLIVLVVSGFILHKVLRH